MSTITLSPASHYPVRGQFRRPIRRPAVRLTRRGRVVVLTALLAVLAALMITFGGLATATLDRGPAPEVRTVTVAPGDTLYGLASGIAEPGKIREAVAEIKQLNSMTDSSLRVGQRIALPLG